MATGTDSLLDSPDMGTADLRGRNALDISVVRSLSGRSDLRGLARAAAHLSAMFTTGTLVYFAMPNWWLLVPAMTLHGFTIVTMFAPMHECVHRTAFNTRWLNEVWGWAAGVLGFYNFHYYRHYHTWHHRYTQDPERDPELSPPKAKNIPEYIREIVGVNFWFPRPFLFLKLALGRTENMPFVPESARRKIALSMSAQNSIYAAAIVSIALGYPYAWFYWFFPAILAQPLLRLLLIAEHTGCSQDENGLTNTRTTLTSFPIRLLMWNMPFHAEHHLYPSIPFYQLPQTHQKLREQLAHLEPNYVAANRTVLRSFRHGEGTNDETSGDRDENRA